MEGKGAHSPDIKGCEEDAGASCRQIDPPRPFVALASLSHNSTLHGCLWVAPGHTKAARRGAEYGTRMQLLTTYQEVGKVWFRDWNLRRTNGPWHTRSTDSDC